MPFYFDYFYDFCDNPDDWWSSTPEEKNLSILTIFLRKPHCAYDFASTPASTFC